MSPIKNYSTNVSEQRTVSEIQELLAAKGARSISVDYDSERRPDAIAFVISFDDFPIPFRLPCNFEGVFESLLNGYRDEKAKRRFKAAAESKSQSRRIAWRIIKDWVAAQIALIEAEQATLAQVFLPYAVVNDGPTRLSMYDKFLAQVAAQRQLKEVNT